MTLARPAWHFSVLNLDNGWIYDSEEGLAYDDTQPVQLTDKLHMGWAFEDEQVPAQTDPDTMTFGLYCKTAADLPTFDKGDRLTAVLTRPLAVGSVTYIKFVGRITDVTPTLDPQRGIVLEFICVDHLSELGQSYSFGPGPNPQTNINDSVGQAIQTVPGAAFHYNTAEAAAAVTHSPNGEASVRDHTKRLLNTAATGVKALFLRCALPFLGWPGGWAQYPVDGNSATISFYPHVWNRGILNLPVPLLKFAMSGTDPDMVTLITNPDADPYAGNADTNPAVVGVSVIPARVVRAPQKFNMVRGNTPNRVEVGFIAGFNADGDPIDNFYYSQDPAAIKRFGATVRKIETYGDINSTYTKSTSILAFSAPGAKWAAESIVLLPHVMTDAEVDRFANNFFPHPQVSLTFRRHIAVLDIAENVDITNRLLFGDLVGATFDINDGKLEIGLNVKPATMYWPAGVGGPTINQWNASAYANTYLTDQGGALDYIDPEITLDHVAVSKL